MLRVNNPVLPNAMNPIKPQLPVKIIAAIGGNDFCNKIRSSIIFLTVEPIRMTSNKHIRNDQIVIIQLHISWSGKYFTSPVISADVLLDEKLQVSANSLMLNAGRCHRNQFSVQQLSWLFAVLNCLIVFFYIVTWCFCSVVHHRLLSLALPDFGGALCIFFFTYYIIYSHEKQEKSHRSRCINRFGEIFFI